MMELPARRFHRIVSGAQETSRRFRFEADREAIERQKQSVAKRLHIRLLAGPAGEERFRLLCLGQTAQPHDLVGGEEALGHLFFDRTNALYIDAKLEARHCKRGEIARVAEIERQRFGNCRLAGRPIAKLYQLGRLPQIGSENAA